MAEADFSKSDPEIAAETFADDLRVALASRLSEQSGWELVESSPLQAVVKMFGTNGEGVRHPFYLKLKADWYLTHPPRVTFVAPITGYPDAVASTRWFPLIADTDPGFRLHAAYSFPGEVAPRQLICSSCSFDYYLSHNPEVGKTWEPGYHKVMWTLSTIQAHLIGAGYGGPARADDS
jgi:hypothetical protein